MRRLLALVLVLAARADASPEIHTRCAAELREHERTLHDELVQALPDAHITLDVSLVTLTETIYGLELEVKAEVRALVSDARGAMHWTSSARSVVRGAPGSRTRLRHDAVIEATRALAATIRRRL